MSSPPKETDRSDAAQARAEATGGEEGLSDSSIYFYGPTKTNGYLSNFYHVKDKFQYDGVSFHTSEHHLMYQKAMLMGDDNTASKIKHVTKPLEAKRLGRQVKPWDQTKWENNCQDIMVNILVAKFSDPQMKPFLESTRGKQLFEASPTDKIWGIGISVKSAESGASHNGRNLLGKALMRAREVIF